MDAETLLASAVISAVVSGVVMLIGKKIDHRQQMKVLLFELAFRIAKERREFTMLAAEKSGSSVSIRDDVFQAADYYRWITHLFDHEENKEILKEERTR